MGEWEDEKRRKRVGKIHFKHSSLAAEEHGAMARCRAVDSCLLTFCRCSSHRNAIPAIPHLHPVGSQSGPATAVTSNGWPTPALFTDQWTVHHNGCATLRRG